MDIQLRYTTWDLPCCYVTHNVSESETYETGNRLSLFTDKNE